MQRKHLGGYLSYLLGELHLRDWSVTVSDEQCEDGAWATIFVTEGQRSATLRLAPNLLKQKPDVIRWVLVHELCHIHSDPVSEALNPVEALIGSPAWLVLRTDFRLAAERANDAIARVIAPHLALPIKGKY